MNLVFCAGVSCDIGTFWPFCGGLVRAHISKLVALVSGVAGTRMALITKDAESPVRILDTTLAFNVL